MPIGTDLHGTDVLSQPFQQVLSRSGELKGESLYHTRAITISLMCGSTDTLQNAIANRDVDLTLGLETDSSIMIRPTLYDNPCILL